MRLFIIRQLSRNTNLIELKIRQQTGSLVLPVIFGITNL